MNIIYDPQIFSLQEYGGISRYFAELAAHMHALGEAEVEIYCPWFLNRHLSAVPHAVLNTRSARPGPRVLRYARHLLAAGNLALFKRRLRDKPFDIVHHTYYRPLPDRLPVRARVATVHDMIDEIIAPNLLKSRLKRKSIRQADHVICVSENTRKALLERYDIAPEKTSVVYHGGPEACHAAAPVRPPEIASAPYILYVGERGGYKNFARLAQAYASSPRLRRDFLLVCFGGRPFSSDERNAFASWGLTSNPPRHCFGDDGMLHALYRNASLFVYPSLYEGFGLPPLEAMSMGVPVACSNSSSIPEVVGQAGEYFEPTRADAIAEAMESVLYSPTRQRELVSLGRERSAGFTWDRCARETLAIYGTLA